MMRRNNRSSLLIILLILILLMTACAPANRGPEAQQIVPPNRPNQTLNQGNQSFGAQAVEPNQVGTPTEVEQQGNQEAEGNGINEETEAKDSLNHTEVKQVSIKINEDSHSVTSRELNNKVYVAVKAILTLLDYEVEEEGNTIQAGFTDVIHQVTKDSAQATVDGEEITLSTPVITIEDDTYISIEDVEKFLGMGYNVSHTDEGLTIRNAEEEFQFPGNENLEEAPVEEGAEDIPTVSAAQADRIIRSARNYLGTPYKFGASTGTTSVFDCSSFTRHVFGQHGITLPRTSRAQANQGRFIPVSQLQKGDLVFFYWPGRYQSNKVVGHVGIYMGNGNIIHTTPSKGVHIVNAKKSKYWSRTYLGAKRVG